MNRFDQLPRRLAGRLRRRARPRPDGRVGAVLVGQVPPPMHGQAEANRVLGTGHYARLDLALVPMRFSRDVGDVGAVRLGKLAELPKVVVGALRARRADRRDVLVYSVGLRGRAAVLRDLVVLGCLRRWFGAVALHVHTGDAGAVLDGLPRPLGALARRVYGDADVVLYPDPVADAGGRGLPRARRVAYVPNGVPDPCQPGAETEFPPAVGARADGATGEHILFMGNLYASKGTEVLIEALGRVAARRRQAGGPLPRLTLVGAAPEASTMDTLRRLASRHEVAELVELPGPAFGRDKEAWFASADVFCFPTFYEAESFPIVLLEAMARSTAIVTTAWRAIPNIVTEGVDGVLVAPRDIDALTDALSALLDDPARRSRLGAAARQTYLRRFTVDAFQAAFERSVLDAVDDETRPTGHRKAPGPWRRLRPSPSPSPALHATP